MARVLTVDDSRAVRSIVVRQLSEWGIESEEAEDGIAGLEKLERSTFDLVLLDVTMPEMDGPAMLAQMRARGDKTPVLMLTSEAKRSIVGTVMRLGIDDYILKPFKPEELRTKVAKIVRGLAPTGGAAGLQSTDGEAGGRRSIDVLLIDDMENVHKRLRALLPEMISLDTCSNAPDTLQRVRESAYRVVIVDNQIPDVNSIALMNQIRALQPGASMITLCLRTADNALDEARRDGYDGVLFKPLTQELVEGLVAAYFDTCEILVVDGGSMRIGAYSGKEDGLERYYTKLAQRVRSDLQKVAEACFDEVELDACKMPVRPERAIKLLLDVAQEASRLGIDLKIRGTSDLGTLLSGLAETACIPFEAVR